MADRNRYRSQDNRDDYDRGGRRDRQPEQFQSDRSYYDDFETQGGEYAQMGDDYPQGRYGQHEEGGQSDRYSSSRDDRGYRGGRGSYGGQSGGGFGAARVDNRERGGFSSFNSESYRTGGDVGPREHRGYGRGESTRNAYSRGSYGAGTYGLAPRRDHGDDDNERGFFERAGDEVASWFGDEEAARRRELDHRGRGPSNYTRSDERILEDACDKLTEDWGIDARNVQVTVQGGELTLDGTVEDRRQKRRAEDVVEEISGVRHVQNNLRTQGSSQSAEDVNRAGGTGDRTSETLA